MVCGQGRGYFNCPVLKTRKDDTVQTLLDIFLKTKEILCKYDYYIYIQKQVLHLTNTELKVPHLMGMQYIGRPNQFTGDNGVYAIKKEMIYRKLDNLYLLEEMFHSYSKLYLYEKTGGVQTGFDCDYLMVHESGKAVLHLGLIKSSTRKGMYHCNSFMTTYQSDRERDIFFCNLSRQYEISKIIREDKQSKERETVYLSEQAELRERTGITKMFAAAGMEMDDELLKMILRLNVKFGEYHTLDMLSDTGQLKKKCRNKREEALVGDFIELWEKKFRRKIKDGI